MASKDSSGRSELGADRESRIADVLRGFSERNTERNRADYLDTAALPLAPTASTMPAPAPATEPVKPARRSWFSK